jgi:hypothetical protein
MFRNYVMGVTLGTSYRRVLKRGRYWDSRITDRNMIGGMICKLRWDWECSYDEFMPSSIRKSWELRRIWQPNGTVICDTDEWEGLFCSGYERSSDMKKVISGLGKVQTGEVMTIRLCNAIHIQLHASVGLLNSPIEMHSF